MRSAAWNVSRSDRLTAPVGHAFALVPIEDAQRRERRRQIATGRQNGATNDFRRQGIRDDDREIADDERMTRQRPRRVARRDARPLEQIEIQFGDEHAILARQAPAVGERRQQLARDADPRTTLGPVGDEDRSGLPGDEEWLARRLDADGDTERARQVLGGAFDVEEVDLARAARPVVAAGRAGPRHRDPARFAGAS